MLFRSTVRKDAQPYRATISILVVMMLVLGLGLFYAMVLRDNHPAPTTKPAGH